ncbi:MAG: ComEC/Rec2 family competence protein [Kiritimatiellae bacterium]|nr:ComEC/Rec2 family competence protein [Kiritimatiellia bacterium]
MQNKLMLFSYTYILGLALAKLYPLDSLFLPALWVLTAILLGGPLLWLAARALRRTGAASPWTAAVFTVLAVVGMVSLGYTRYISADSVPDHRLGTITVTGGAVSLKTESALPDASRLRLVKQTELDEDVRLRFHGELDARQPVLDERGLPSMDARARWRFKLVRVPQQSEVITIAAGDPVGTQYLVAQPFSRITQMEVLAPKNTGQTSRGGLVALYRVSNHIGSFARPGRNQAPLTILGRITSDPLVYDFKTVLPVTPAFVQAAAGGPFFKVEGGDVHITIKPDMIGYDSFARTEAYGSDIVAKGGVSIARASSNPGGYNPRRTLQNSNIFGMMDVVQDRDSSEPPLRQVGPAGGPSRTGNPVVRFSLGLRDRMLRVLKLTVPYPHTAFLGGVTLGLRYGLQNTPCLFGSGHGQVPAEGEDEPAEAAPVVGCEEYIAEEFKISGVNHVLAVSGLHVTIITVMFVSIFTLLRLPRQVYTPLIILALVIFAIITGARPSVLRAVIMHGLVLLTLAYMKGGLRSSVLFGVAVAAFLILLENPLVLVDPSFTLSFGAILSLGLITPVAFDLLSRLRGNVFFVFILLALLVTGIGMLNWPLLVSAQFIVPFTLFAFALRAGAQWLERRDVRLIGRFGFTDLPQGPALFLASQVAIQVGMMLPLSTFYFARWPFAGAYANLVAIPLIGVVVQLAAMAGLLGLIPGIGLYIATVLSAANLLFSTAFLWLAHICTKYFPYPFSRRPSARFLLAYFLLCAVWIWNKPLRERLRQWGETLGWPARRAVAAGIAGLVILATVPAWFGYESRSRRELEVTVLSIGYGSSIFIETPNGKNILVDAGFVEHERGRLNQAERNIVPFLAYKNIRRLDALVMTSPRPERAAGIGYVLQGMWVDQLYLPAGLVGLDASWTAEDLLERLAGAGADQYSPVLADTMHDELVGSPLHPRRVSLARSLYARRDTIWNRWADTVVRVEPLKAGAVLAEETVDGQVLRLEVLHPGGGPEGEFPIENNSAVLRLSYGDFAMLLTSDLHFAGQRNLAQSAEAAKLKAQVLVFPHHGAAQPRSAPDAMKDATEAALISDTQPLLDKVAPEKVVFEFGNPRPALGLAGRDAVSAFELTWRFVEHRLGADACFNTDRDLAVIVRSDGRGYTLKTQAQENRAQGGEEGAVAEIDMAF